MANSNAIAQVNIFDQDLLSAGQPNIVQRVGAQILLAVPNALLYSGYTNVTSTSFSHVLPPGNACPFAYVRNVGTNQANPLILEVQQTGGGSVIALNLYPGGIFMFCNGINTQTPAPSTLMALDVAVLVGASSLMEYMVVY
jgi:hypothetical protein